MSISVLPHLTEEHIHELCTLQSYERGESYYRKGAVLEVIRRGNRLTALVEGSQYEPYRVSIALDEAGVHDAWCSCPYDWGGYCKHIVAVLLTYIRQPESFRVRPEPAELLAPLSREELLALLSGLMEKRPELLDWVERTIAARQLQTEKPRQRRTPLDAEPFRHHVQSVLNRVARLDYWEAYEHMRDMVGELAEVRDQAAEFTRAGDGRNALTIR